MAVNYLSIPGYAGNPAFSELAVIPPGASWVLIGGQNAVNEKREIVGKGDAVLQAETVKRRIDAALKAAGCGWADVVRVQVFLAAGVDARVVYPVFAPVFAGRKAPPLVSGCQVQALAHPDFLLEVSVEAVRP